MFGKRKRQAAANTVAEIFRKHYCALRSEIQSHIRSGAEPRYMQREWLNDIGIKYSEADLKQDVLYYNSNEDAFRSACYFAEGNPSEGAILPAIVEKAEPTPDDGLQQCSLKVARGGGGIEIRWCTTIDATIPKILVGDLVAFQVIATPAEFAHSSVLGRVGFVVAKLEPVQSVRRGWKISK